MIPTRLKVKLRPTMSWPIGAAAISEALAGAPNCEHLVLTFSDYHSVAVDRRLAADEPHTILRVTHAAARKPGFTGSQGMVDAGYFDEAWQIEVNAVRRDHRQLANQLLRREGLPAVRRWLESSTDPVWMQRSRSIAVVFEPARHAVRIEEHVTP